MYIVMHLDDNNMLLTAYLEMFHGSKILLVAWLYMRYVPTFHELAHIFYMTRDIRFKKIYIFMPIVNH